LGNVFIFSGAKILRAIVTLWRVPSSIVCDHQMLSGGGTIIAVCCNVLTHYCLEFQNGGQRDPSPTAELLAHPVTFNFDL